MTKHINRFFLLVIILGFGIALKAPEEKIHLFKIEGDEVTIDVAHIDTPLILISIKSMYCRGCHVQLADLFYKELKIKHPLYLVLADKDVLPSAAREISHRTRTLYRENFSFFSSSNLEDFSYGKIFIKNSSPSLLVITKGQVKVFQHDEIFDENGELGRGFIRAMKEAFN